MRHDFEILRRSQCDGSTGERQPAPDGVSIDMDALHVSLRGHPVLAGVDLTLRAGQIYGLVGPRESGKTTVIFAALGLVRRSAGSVRVFGPDPNTRPRDVRRRCGVVPQSIGFYDWMSAPAYLRFFARLHRARRTGIPDLLRQVGIEPEPNRPIATFAPGTRRRLALARALVGDPELLLLDEPTAGMDDTERAQVHALLRSLAGRGTGILLCTDHAAQIDALCDRIGVIAHGRTLAEGSAGELLGGARSRRFRLRLDGPLPGQGQLHPELTVACQSRDAVTVDIDPRTPTDRLWQQLRTAGWPIAEIQPVSALESYYSDIDGQAP